MPQASVDDVSVVGLGKLGSCLAVTLAHAGFSVVGADQDERVVDQLDAGDSPVPEPKMDEYLAATGDDLRATTDTSAAVAATDATFVVVNTPSTEAGRYDLAAVEAACERIGETLAETDDYHLVVLTSTVFPGATTGAVEDTLERTSGKVAGEGFGLCYSPEFIALGNAIEGLEDPDFFLIGEHTERAGDVLEHIYGRLGDESTPVARMAPVEAEIAKMAVNAYVTMKISYANTLGEICEGMGGDVDVVTDALALDSRIDGDYLSAGARFGGPCFPRDSVAFGRLATDAGTEAPLADGTDRVNDQHTRWIADAVRETTPSGGTVAVLGMTYKPGTYIIEESQGVELVAQLRKAFDIVCCDPMGLAEVRRTLGDDVDCQERTTVALRNAETAVLATPWEEFTDPATYSNYDGTLVDPWRRLDPTALPATVEYRPLGNGRRSPAPAPRTQ